MSTQRAEALKRLSRPGALISCLNSWSPNKIQAFDRLMGLDPQEPSMLDLIRVLPKTVMLRAGMTPDPWQKRLLSFLDRAQYRLLVNCSRQVGKTLTSAALSLATALTSPNADIVVISRTQRQTSEFIRKVKWFRLCLTNPMRMIGAEAPRPVTELDGMILADIKADEADSMTAVRDAVTMEEFPNRSRIIALPGKSAGAIMGYGVKLLIIDEACWFPDGVYEDIPPMLAATKGSMLCLSYGGFLNGSWWDKAWHTESGWERIREPVTSCPRISPEFLKQERERLSPQGYKRNYECGFVAEEGAFFDPRDVERMFV